MKLANFIIDYLLNHRNKTTSDKRPLYLWFLILSVLAWVLFLYNHNVRQTELSWYKEELKRVNGVVENYKKEKDVKSVYIIRGIK